MPAKKYYAVYRFFGLKRKSDLDSLHVFDSRAARDKWLEQDPSPSGVMHRHAVTSMFVKGNTRMPRISHPW